MVTPAHDPANDPAARHGGRDCPGCATPLPQAARFCMTCGTPVGTPKRTPMGLRFVTVAFCDISGSTQLATRLSPEVWHGVLDRYFARMRAAIESCGGRVEKFIGDAVVGVFGADRPADDDALRAVRAALDGLARSDAEAVAEDGHGIRLTVRFGVASGQVVLADRDSSFAIGAVMNRAARLQSAAPVGGALIDVRTWLLVRDQVRCDQVPPVTAKGFDTALQAWTVASGAQEPLPAAPFVNQRDLLGRVRAELAVRLRTAGRSVITVDGEVGSGKTALLRRLEGSTELDQALVLPVDCDRDDREQGLWRLLQLDRDLAALQRGGAAPAAGTARPGPAASTAEVRWRIGQRLAALSRERAVVLLVDNAQWAPDALWEVVDGTVPAAGPTGSGGSVVFVLAGREVPGGVRGTDGVAPAFTVRPLSTEHSRRLLGLLRAGPGRAERSVPDLELHFVGADADADALVDRAGGNPLFLEQLAALAADGIDDLVAPSASAALGARIEALSPASRRVLACLGAWGTSVGSAALAATCGLEPGELGDALAELTALGLAPRQQRRSAGGGRRYECHSAAQVAYAQSSLADRASVHAAVARHLQRRAADTPSALDPAAVHAERSHACLRELRPGSAEELAAAELAAGCLVAAARCAVGRSDVRQAVELVARARRLGSAEPALTLEIASIESYALAACGRTDEALRLIDAMKAEVPAAANPAAAFQLLANELALRPAGPEALASAREPAERAGDLRSEARLLLLAGLDSIGSGDYPRAERLLLRAHDGVRRTGPGLGTAEIHANLSLCLAYGDRPVDDALRRCRGLGEDTADAPVLHALVGCSEALLRQSAGDGAGARGLLDRAAEVFAGVGHPAGLAGLHRFRSAVAEYAGELSEAAAELREAAEVYLGLGADATAARCRAAAWVLERSAEPASGTGSAPAAPELPAPAFGWDAELLECQVRALSGDRDVAREQLRRALDVIGAVRGAGARLLPLAGCLRLARRSGAEEREREAEAALDAAAAARGAVRPAV
ncbi:adenylate/guanylate cyclase domain-containing protein [Streptacidiphilus rugosus]|uniref:adenylate/guanylate cyclase domain-containing protein n=1 Tax=Streptacidiphilus rugosus TaxID=405783 RepID=UPI0006909C99|nr:adenylate/guanylate cyclase domain-containing protein [Streptacidiphilus rugosus]